MSFLTKLNWKNYESYFKDIGVNDAKGGNVGNVWNLEVEILLFFIYNMNSYHIKLI